MIALVKVNGYDIDELHIQYRIVMGKFTWKDLFYIRNNTKYVILEEYVICSLNGIAYTNLEEFVNTLLSRDWDNVCWIDLKLTTKDRNPNFFIAYKTIEPSKFIDSCKISFSKKYVTKDRLSLVFSDVSKYIALRFYMTMKMDIIKLEDLFINYLFGHCSQQNSWGGFIEEKSMFYLPSVREQGCYYFTSTEEDIKKFKARLIKESFLNGNIRY